MRGQNKQFENVTLENYDGHFTIFWHSIDQKVNWLINIVNTAEMITWSPEINYPQLLRLIVSFNYQGEMSGFFFVFLYSKISLDLGCWSDKTILRWNCERMRNDDRHFYNSLNTTLNDLLIKGKINKSLVNNLLSALK